MGDLQIVDEALVGLIGAESENDVYDAVLRATSLLVPGAYVAISALSLDGEAFSVVETAGLESLTRPLKKLLGKDPATVTFPVSRMRPQDHAVYRSGKLEELEGGLYRLMLSRFPKAACATAERLLGITAIYVAGFAWEEMNYGTLMIGLKKGVRIATPGSIEMLAHQATIAIRRFRAEAELHERNAELGVFFTESLDLLCIAGMDGVFRHLNPHWEEALGHSREELTSRRFMEFVHPDDVASTEAAMAGLAAGEAQLQFANRYRTKDGDYRWLEWRAFPLGDLIYAAARDLTERVEAEQALRASEARYRLIADNTADVIWILDLATTRFTYVSPSIERLRGYTVEESLEQTMAEAVMPRSLAYVTGLLPGRIAAFEAGDESQRIRTDEFEQPRKDGTIVPTEATTTLLTNAEGRVDRILGASRDITERRQAAAQIQTLNVGLETRVRERTAQLEDAIAELEAFSYSVSHDLRAPLRAINGYATILEEDYAARIGTAGVRYCDNIVAGTRRMGQLIDDLLAFSRLGRSRLAREPIDMAALARSAYSEVTTESQRGSAALTLGPLASATGDPTLLRQVWSNLLSNALKFTARVDAPRITVISDRGEAETVYSVADNGTGFDMKHAGKLFQVFERLHGDQYEGSGIGLAIVRRAVEAHGSRVWAESSPGQGAVFSFALPTGPAQRGPAS